MTAREHRWTRFYGPLLGLVAVFVYVEFMTGALLD